VRFTCGEHFGQLIASHVFAKPSATVIRHMIIRDVTSSSRTSATRFAAPDPHVRHETRQHLNGWILIFCFRVLASSVC
jgi:hypothetical protein